MYLRIKYTHAGPLQIILISLIHNSFSGPENPYLHLGTKTALIIDR